MTIMLSIYELTTKSEENKDNQSFPYFDYFQIDNL